MRHRSKIKHFNRDTKSRKALFKTLVRSLVEHGSITTTESKAKEIKRIADKIIARAKVDSVANRRILHKFFGRRDVVNTLVDRVAPEFEKRVSGFTTIENVGLRRGDNTKLAKLSLIKMPKRVGSLKNEKKEVKKEAKPKAKKATSKKAPVKQASKPAKKTAAKKESK